MTEKDNLERLPTVGPQKEANLNDDGYYTFEDLCKSHPLTLNQESNIVLASASNIIVSAVNELDGVCPNCKSGEDLSPSWSSSKRINPPSDSSDIQCECGWDGNPSELHKNNQEQQAKYSKQTA